MDPPGQPNEGEPLRPTRNVEGEQHLVVQGHEPQQRRSYHATWLLVFLLLVWPGLLAFSELTDIAEILPWTHPEVLFYGLVLALPAGILLLVVLAQRARSRQGWVVIFRERILITKYGRTTEVAWEDLAGYTQPSAGCIQLHRRNERLPAAELSIPALDEEERVAVLAQLDSRGVLRLG